MAVRSACGEVLKQGTAAEIGFRSDFMKVRALSRKSEFKGISAEVSYSRRLERWRRRGLESRKCSRIRPSQVLDLELCTSSLVRACMI